MGVAQMTVAALYSKHRPLARSLARRIYVPGSESQDVQQEADVALWIAARNWDPEKGAFPAFATTVIQRRLASVLRAALVQGRRILSEADRDGLVLIRSHVDDVERIAVDRDQLRRIIDALIALPEAEREGLAAALSGEPQSKQTSNAAYRARRKLKEVAA